MDMPTSSPNSPNIKRSRRRSTNQFRSAVRRIWQDWWVEILIGLLVGLAIFLLVEQMNIRQTLRRWLLALWHGIEGLVSGLAQMVARQAQRTTLSDLLAYCLILLAIALVLWRARRRLMTQPRFTTLKCPRCGSDVYRVHRHWHDHLLDLYVPVRRYQCESHDCGWRGLRVKRFRQG